MSQNNFQDIIRIFKVVLLGIKIPLERRVYVYYEMGKNAQTKLRDLKLALNYYLEAIRNEDHIDSSIKDFASVLHQMGKTNLALQLLNDTQIQQYYNGDIKKYNHLKMNFELQLKPTGKHTLKRILLINLLLETNTQQDILNLFYNPQRINSIQIYYDLSLTNKLLYYQVPHFYYVILYFKSFSAAKKTLETFKQSQCFGINKYWLNQNNQIIFKAKDGRKDFQYLLNYQEVEKQLYSSENIFLNYVINDHQKQLIEDNYQHKKKRINAICIRLIQQYAYQQYQKEKSFTIQDQSYFISFLEQGFNHQLSAGKENKNGIQNEYSSL